MADEFDGYVVVRFDRAAKTEQTYGPYPEPGAAELALAAMTDEDAKQTFPASFSGGRFHYAVAGISRWGK